MSERVTWVFPAGKLTDENVVKGTAAAAGKGDFSDDEDDHRMTVPAGKRWLVYSMAGKPDVNATFAASIHNAADQYLVVLTGAAAGVAAVSWPDYGAGGTTGAGTFPIPLKAGDYIKFTFGAQQAATAYVNAIILEIDI